MVAIPFPTTTWPGHENHVESRGRLINAFAEQLGQDKAKRVRVSGLTLRHTSNASFNDNNALMLVEPDAALYASFPQGLYRAQHTGVSPAPTAMTLHHSLITPNEGTSSLAHNNKVSPECDKVWLTGGVHTPVLIQAAGGITAYPYDFVADQGTQPNSVCNVSGYFFFTFLHGTVMASGLNDTTQDPLSVAKAISEPDLLIKGVNHNGRLVLFGRHSTEIWTDVGSSPFPFQRAASISHGLLRDRMVAGHEDGFGAGLLWVADDMTVKQLDGYNAVSISPPDLNRLIERAMNEDHETERGPHAHCYIAQGHPIWGLTFNHDTRGWTWCYDLSTRQWHERASHLRPFGRIKHTVLDFENRWLASDFGTDPIPPGGGGGGSNLYYIDATNYTEDGNPLRARVESAAVSAFPARTRVYRADFELETGVGITGGQNPIETDPTVLISWSDDGGVTWSNPLTRALGQQAQYRDISIYNVGRSTRHGRRWRLDVSDPVYFTLMGGDQSAEPRR